MVTYNIIMLTIQSLIARTNWTDLK